MVLASAHDQRSIEHPSVLSSREADDHHDVAGRCDEIGQAGVARVVAQHEATAGRETGSSSLGLRAQRSGLRA